MENLQFPISSILLSFLLLVFIAIKTLKKQPQDSPKLPPGPWKLPIIGNIHQLGTSLPHHGLRNLAKKYGPIMSFSLGQLPTVVISSPEIAQSILKTHDAIFAFRPRILMSEIMFYNSSDIAFSPSNEYWQKLRKIFSQELLSSSRVRSFSLLRHEAMQSLVDWIECRVESCVNLTKRIHSMNYGITSRAAFGKIKSEDLEEFVSIVMESLGILGGFDLADSFPSFGFLDPIFFGTRAKLERLHQKADRIYEKIIEEHKERKSGEKSVVVGRETEDLIDVLLKFHDENGLGFSLTKDNIKAVIWDIFAAGSETSATTTDWAMAEMMKNPRVMKKAQNEVRKVFNKNGLIDETSLTEMKYLKCVVKETLRLHPTAPLLLPRECQDDFEFDGYKIPSKTRVLINAWAVARDPRYWIDPENFLPERFLDSSIDFRGTNFEYIPFGAGRRICPGILFGLINVEFPLAILLYHFDWKLPEGINCEDLDMTEAFGVTVVRKHDLNLVPIAHELSPISNFLSRKKSLVSSDGNLTRRMETRH